MDLWMGTTNKGKLSEFKMLAEKSLPDLVVRGLNEVPSYIQPPENGKTFLENARIKAKSLKAMKPGQWVMAEDSGIEVDALGNFPGIHSARYAGPKAADSENVAKLLKMMILKHATNRNARFVCSMVAYDPAGVEHVFEGVMKGTISPKPVGIHGFGYDPIFIPEGETKTLAELGPGYKIANSHRTKAGLQLLPLVGSR